MNSNIFQQVANSRGTPHMSPEASTPLRPVRCPIRVRVESGYTVTIQAIYYTVLLFIFFALIFDFGNAGYVATVGTEAARLAAQDAAKNIDQQAFIDNQ